MAPPLLLRNTASGKLVPAAGPLVIGAIFAFYLLKGVAIGAPASRLAVLALLTLGCLGFGLVLARGAFDRGVQVVLDEAGFRDRREGDVLVPWGDVARATLVPSMGDGPATVLFELTGPLPDPIRRTPAHTMTGVLPFGRNTVRMEISSLDTTERAVMEAIRRLAPGVPVS